MRRPAVVVAVTAAWLLCVGVAAEPQWAVSFNLKPYGPYTFVAGAQLGDNAGLPPSEDGVDPWDVPLDESPETGIWIKSMIGGGDVPYTEDYMAPLDVENQVKVFRHLYVDGWLPPGSGPVVMTWDISLLPEGWRATLTDLAVGRVIDLREEDSYSFFYANHLRPLLLEVSWPDPQWAIEFSITGGYHRCVVGAAFGSPSTIPTDSTDGVDPWDVPVGTVPLTGVWMASAIGGGERLFFDDMMAPLSPGETKHFGWLGVHGWLPDVPQRLQLNFDLSRLPAGWSAILTDNSTDPPTVIDLRQWRSYTFTWNNTPVPFELDVTRPGEAYVRPLLPGWNLIGYMRADYSPCLLASCRVVRSGVVKWWRDAAIAGWVMDPCFYYGGDTVGYRIVSAFGGGDDHLRSGFGYWVLNLTDEQVMLLIP